MPRRRGGEAGRGRGGGHARAGWPTGEHSPITPEGELEQLGKLLSGLAGQRGWLVSGAGGGSRHGSRRS